MSDQSFGVDMVLDAKEFDLTFEQFSERYLRPAFAVIADQTKAREIRGDLRASITLQPHRDTIE